MKFTWLDDRSFDYNVDDFAGTLDDFLTFANGVAFGAWATDIGSYELRVHGIWERDGDYTRVDRTFTWNGAAGVFDVVDR